MPFYIQEIQEIIDKYLKFLEFHKNYSKLTLKSYKSDLFQFFDLKGPSKPQKKGVLPPSPEARGATAGSPSGGIAEESFTPKARGAAAGGASPPPLSAFLKKIIVERPPQGSSATRNRKTAVLKSFLKWLHQNGYIDEDLNRKIKSPKIAAKIPSFLSLDEVTALIDAVKESDKRQDKNAKRDLTLILLLYGGGLRVSEACKVCFQDFDFEKRTLLIEGKGSKERLITLPRPVTDHLLSLKKNTNYVFGEKPLSQKTAYLIVRNWGQRSGLKKNISPHVLRHSYATHLLESGSDLRILQSLLGHESLSATQKYTKIQLSQMEKTLSKHHPLSLRESS